jgi:hypothetical protein
MKKLLAGLALTLALVGVASFGGSNETDQAGLPEQHFYYDTNTDGGVSTYGLPEQH